MKRKKYQLGNRLGGGGMAEVFRATLIGVEGFSRPVAIKRVLPGMSSDEAFSEMFVREAKIASLLTHPNITSVIDFDHDEEGRLFIVMELVEGYDLRNLIRRGSIPPPAATQIAADILRALDYAHSLEHDGRPMQIVHRDVTPHNVLLSSDGSVKLSDFGIAKALADSPLTRTGIIKGKAAYLSPEQARAEPLDGRSDLFAVGIILHEMLSGERLFGGASDAVVMHRIQSAEIAPVTSAVDGISSALNDVCMKLLDRDRDRRYRTAKDALDALLRCPEVSARGPLEVVAVLRERFPPSETVASSRPHVPEKAPLGDFTQVAPQATELADVDMPTTPDDSSRPRDSFSLDDPPAEETKPTISLLGEFAHDDAPNAHMPVLVAPVEITAGDLRHGSTTKPHSESIPPTLMPPSRRWSLALPIAALATIAAAGLVVAVRSRGQTPARSTDVRLVKPASVDNNPPVVVTPRATVEPEPTTNEPTDAVVPSGRRRVRRSGSDERAAPAPVDTAAVELSPNHIDRAAVARRVETMGNRIRQLGRALPSTVAGDIDLRYLDLEATARSAKTEHQWETVVRQLDALDRKIDAALATQNR